MGISYDPTKPAANDRPANDQAPMQTNFASIKTLLDVDHVDFSSSNYGKHLQVTFGSNNVPSLPTSFPYLFTNNQDGVGNALPVPSLFFYNGTATQSSTQYVAQSTAGSTFLFGGIILKWGHWTLAPGVASAAVTFVSPFPNNVFALTFGTDTSGSPNNAPNYSALTTTGFTGGRIAGSSGGTYTYFYVAIGN